LLGGGAALAVVQRGGHQREMSVEQLARAMSRDEAAAALRKGRRLPGRFVPLLPL
jgi:hypothetical protein